MLFDLYCLEQGRRQGILIGAKLRDSAIVALARRMGVSERGCAPLRRWEHFEKVQH